MVATHTLGSAGNTDYCLRTFPIWGGDLFHGATCCNLSATLTLTPTETDRPAVAVVFIDGKPLCDVVLK